MVWELLQGCINPLYLSYLPYSGIHACTCMVTCVRVFIHTVPYDVSCATTAVGLGVSAQ